MPTSDISQLDRKGIEDLERRVSEKTGTPFDAIRDWDWHRYDYGTFGDPHKSVHATERKIARQGHNTVDDAVMLYVLKAFDAISCPSKFKEYAGKAKALLDAVAESY